MKNILIVDNDLGFIFWLGDALIRAHYQPWPSCSVKDAITLMGYEPEIPLDLLIVDQSLPRAADLVALYRRSQPHLKVIALGAFDKRMLPGVNAWCPKPTAGNQAIKQKWVRAIDRLSQGYQRAA